MSSTNHPKHVAIILDGNRRFAKKLMLEPWKGHDYGYKKVEQLIDWCIEQNIKELTLYAFSLQNFNRPKEEFNYLMDLFRESFKKFYVDERVEKHAIKVNIIGRRNLFSEDIQENFSKIMEKTANNKGFIVNIAMGYGGREEIIDAVKKLVKDAVEGKMEIQNITEENFEKYLYTRSEPDMIVRTGGEMRTSNFLPWQSNYSEWFFLDKTWPEFDKTDFLKVLEEYGERERRFGR